jgi:hypothetical protein
MAQSITQDEEEHDLHDAVLDSSSSLSIKITELDSSFRSQEDVLYADSPSL